MINIAPRRGFDPDEVARIDKWIDVYVGKQYGGNASEVVSMAYQNFKDPESMRAFAAKDFDHFSFVLGLLSGAI